MKRCIKTVSQNSLRPVMASLCGGSTLLHPSVISHRFASTLVLDEVRDILPPKRLVKLYLFQNRIPLSYNKVIQSYAACWGSNDEALPSGVTGQDLVRLKNILESHRKKTGSVTRLALKLEANLIERAAELGDNTAVALLCGRTVLTPTKPNLSEEQARQEEEDKAHAMKLLNQLSEELNFPLAFKLKGDIAYKMGRPQKAEELYQACLDNLPESGSKKSDSHTSILRVECLRTIGLIRFNMYDVDSARTCFELAILEAENGFSGNPAQAMDCHYYLGQISAESDKKRAQYHLEQAARMGLKEAFSPLGFLLLNYFGKKDLAKEWFDLGASIGEQTSMIGQYDVAILNNDIPQTAKYLKNIRKSIFDSAEADKKDGEPSSSPEETFANVMKSRAKSVKVVENYIREHDVIFDVDTVTKNASQLPTSKPNHEPSSMPKPVDPVVKSSKSNPDSSRWGF